MPASAAAPEPDQGNDIIVTASKRAEKLQDVPSAINAISGEQLVLAGVQNLRDYSSLVPGFSLRDIGNPGQATIVLRGLNTGPQQGTATSAFYIDDAPFSASGFISAGSFINPDLDIADVERIEVLKGPQGTLYGANSLGGLVKVVSKRPDAHAPLSGMAMIEGTTIDGGGTGYALRAALNVPLVSDVLAIRANGVYRRAPGWTDNVGTGTKDVNHSRIAGGKLALRFTPGNRFTFDLTGIYQDIDNNGYAQQDNVTSTLTPRYGRDKYLNVLDLGSHLRYTLASGIATYDLGRVSLIGSASYAKYDTRVNYDYTENYIGYTQIVPTLAAIIPPGSQGIAELSPNMKKFSAELRLVSRRIGPIEFVAGGFYTDEKNHYRVDILVNNAAGVPLPGAANLLLKSDTLSNYEEEAAFGNLTLYLTDKLDVTGGLRYAHNSQFAETGGPGSLTFYVPRATVDFNFSDYVTTYLGALRWRPTPSLSFYARAASGYRPGGPQTNPTPPAGAQTSIRADTTWNYEAGVKGSMLGGVLSFDASAYHIDWKDIQLNTLFGGVTLQANGGDAKVDGVELSFTARPTRLLTFSASAGYTNARIRRIDPGVRTSTGANIGDRLPLTPDWTVSLLGDQRVPLRGDATADLGATLRFRSDMPNSYPGSALNPNIEIPDLTTLDLRAGVDFHRFTVQARVENVLNAAGYTTITTNKIYAAQPVASQGIVIRPRSFTLSLTTNF
ncbi:TonB-dependent receptor [Sphingomonas sp.]|uniref:TonB-dependent receptor n=1 Tax=Sphingomonas sp. TaxID=28214 RepID=UPI003D6D2A83